MAAEELEQTGHRHAQYWAARSVSVAAWPQYQPAAVGEALTDIMTMLNWAITHDGELADRVLASIAITTFGMGRWAELHRICDWMLADRPAAPTGPEPLVRCR